MSGTAPPWRRPWWLSWPGLLALASLALAWRGARGDLGALFGAEAARTAADFARGLFPPAHGVEFLRSLARPLAETVAIAVAGMGLALALGAPLALGATSPSLRVACGGRPSLAARAVWLGSRFLLSVMRSVPEVVWALLFVRAVGLGATPGVLAIGVAYGGVLGKVFAEILESAPRGAAAALASAGAPPRRALLLGVAPAARPLLASYAFYRFDCALRASAVLGLVGAGGVGQQVELSLKMLAWDEVATEVLLLFALVAGVDLASAWARRRLLARPALFPSGARSLGRDALGLAALAAAVLASAAFLGLDPGTLLSAESLGGVAAFLGSLWPPEASRQLLGRLLPAAAETLSASVLGTALAAGLGIALAWPAALRLHAVGADADPAWMRAGRTAAAMLARAAMNLGRSLPELVWALLFVLAVGLGPFAGALALGVHTGGVLGRLYAEVLEEAPPAPARALRTAGAGRLGAALFAVLPQAAPQLLAYTLYRWEVNVRASAVLGVVGAGGLGRELYVALSLFQGRRATTLILAILALVTAVDLFSGWLRGRLAAGAAPAAPGRAAAGEAIEGAAA
ncbi:MAG TPA: ABC transporter permease subunit [Anaeromyxobacteraceae bacterium]|nr:ABC transporter permease subunit [Anaeromyxobacteraceae bacterium]